MPFFMAGMDDRSIHRRKRWLPTNACPTLTTLTDRNHLPHNSRAYLGSTPDDYRRRAKIAGWMRVEHFVLLKVTIIRTTLRYYCTTT